MSKPELYFSVDIETDGPCPGLNSLLSIGAVAYDREGLRVGETFSANLKQMLLAKPDPATMREFWAKHPEAWEACRENPMPASAAIRKFVSWVDSFSEYAPVFVAYPAGFDFTFIYWYCHYFLGRCPFRFQALDIKSFAMAVLGTDFNETTKKTMPKEWFPPAKHSHIALEDAIEQGELFVNILNHARERNRD